jgi:hypothetical protein
MATEAGVYMAVNAAVDDHGALSGAVAYRHRCEEERLGRFL